MKAKKFLLPLLLILSYLFVLSACSNDAKLNFDENATIKLTYTCVEEGKNFEAELNAEKSKNFVLSLNKISYIEVNDKDINFAPSYDNLIIKINNETISLFDVGYAIKDGGFFYLNGKLCETKDRFSFLESYFAEHCPDIVLRSISFNVQYVKQTVAEEENYKIVKNVTELNDYITTETQKINLPLFELFKSEVIERYDDEYFENSFIVIFMKAASSGSFDFKVNDVSISGNRLIINYEIFLPGESGEDVAVTGDMAYWYSFVELSNEYSTIKNVDIISLK